MIQRAIIVMTTLYLGQPAQSPAPPTACKTQAPPGAHPFAEEALARLAGDFEIRLDTNPYPRHAVAFRVHLYQSQAPLVDTAARQANASSLLAGWIVPSGSDSSEIADDRDPNNPSITWEDRRLHIHTYVVVGNHVLRPGPGYTLAIAWYTRDAFGGRWMDDGLFLSLRIPRTEGYFCARRITKSEQ